MANAPARATEDLSTPMTSEPSGRGLNAGSPHTSSLYSGLSTSSVNRGEGTGHGAEQARPAAMRTQVARDLRWLQGRCEKVAVVGHSQGAAIAHQVLKNGDYRPESLRAFITIGQGISKLHLLQRSAAYIVLAVIPWRIMEECLVHHFFSTAERCSGARQPDSTEPPRQAMARAVD
jgi:hypothetical protein